MPSDNCSRRKSDIKQENNNNNRIKRIKTTNNNKLPNDYIKCDKTELIIIISRMLNSIVLINDKNSIIDINYLNSKYLTRFHSRSPPQISIYNYLIRLSHYSSLENCVLIATVYYIDLLTKKFPLFALNSLTVHRFLLTATTIASKALCDSFCSNKHYAKVGGVNIIELNLLEIEFLKWVNYRVVPRDFNYDNLYDRKNSQSSINNGTGNGSGSGGGTGNSNSNASNDYDFYSLKYGIAIADKILDLYYVKMVSLVGENFNNKNAIGYNDDINYYLNDTQDQLNNDAQDQTNTDNHTSANQLTHTPSTSSSSSDDYPDNSFHHRYTQHLRLQQSPMLDAQ